MTILETRRENLVRRLSLARERPTQQPAWQPYAKIAAFCVLVPLVVLTTVESRSAMYLVDLWLVYSVAVIGFYWVFGLAGRFAFCHTFSMAFGAYLSAWATRDGRVSVWLGLLLAVVGVGVFMAIVGWILSRSNELYFAVGTLAVMYIGLLVFRRWTAFTGVDGTVIRITPISLFGLDLSRDREVFWLFLAILALVLLMAVFIDRSPLKREAIAARDIGLVARTLGIRTGRVQLLFFVLGSCTAALSGWMLAHWSGIIGAASFGVDLAIGIFLMVVLGGLKSYWGPVIGAAFYVAVPDYLRDFEEFQPLVYAGLLLIVVIAVPDGLAGVAGRVTRFLRRRHTRTPSAPTPAVQVAGGSDV